MSGTTNIPSCYVILRNGDKALFVLRSHTGYMDGDYCLPAGRVEHSESFSMAAAREALEEVGVIIEPTKLRHAHTMHRFEAADNIRVDVFFEADEWEGEPENMEPDKHSAIAWLSLSNLPENVMGYQRHALEQIKKGSNYCEFGWDNS